jgi:PAS domain S-box-containing protein
MMTKDDEHSQLRSVALQNAESIFIARQRAERQSEFYLTEAQRLAHVGSWAFNTAGFFEYWSPELYHIYGLDSSNGAPALEEYLRLVHPQDRDVVARTIERMLAEGSGCDVKKRIVRPDGQLRYVRSVGCSIFEHGKLKSIIGTTIDVTEQERMTQELRRREAYLVEAQRLSHTGSFGWNILNGEIYWSAETFRIFGCEPTTKVTVELIRERTHPEDRSAAAELLELATREKTEFDFEQRLLMRDGSIKYLRIVGHPSEDESGCLEFVGAVTDLTAAKQAERELRRSEESLLEAQRLSHTGSWRHNLLSGEVTVSPEVFRIRGIQPDDDASRAQFFFDGIHPDDQSMVRQLYQRARIEKTDYEADYRIVLPDGTIKHLHTVGHPICNESNDAIEFVGTAIDVTKHREAEAKIRQSEKQLRQLLDLTPQHITEFGPDGSPLYNNRAALDYHGLTLEEWQNADLNMLLYPHDAERMRREGPSKFLSGSPYEVEVRLRRKDGQYRWFLFRYNPMRDEQGRVTRWYAAATDIDDRKQAEQRLRNENVALREEIDKASMFEEIVGTSSPLQRVLSRTSKVAATDSNVLITGETGTGKELFARAIHRRSLRSSRPFVSVNCAAVPTNLITSELFGHEKGSFTGATHQRLGRFELAEGGTIFLDEVGELPAETQIALLRVLQEHEFERVGGTQSIRTDVRVIAATNRDLEAAIVAGLFRSDLFYRLNVFPIEIPPLRERKEDIPLLVEYFIDRYARKTGKSFQAVDKKSLELLQSYSWPGNIRELQNIIERSVIVCETQNFSVDKSWLSGQTPATQPWAGPDLLKKLPPVQEKAIIEAALGESGGRVYGPSGAAARLGVPRSTLESKIRALKIDKNRFKAADVAEKS